MWRVHIDQPLAGSGERQGTQSSELVILWSTDL